MTTVPRAAPEISTERLLLRGHAVEDLDDAAAMWGDPAIVRHIGGKTFTREEVWGKVLRHGGHWALLGFGYWVIREKASGRFVGEAGFADMKRTLPDDVAPLFHGAPEAGWALATWAQGRGFASEAVRAVVAWGDERFGRARTVCMIDPGNEPSRRLAGKLGFVELARTTYHGDATILFERRGSE